MRTLLTLCFCYVLIQCSVDKSITSLTPIEYNNLKKFQDLDSVNKVTIANETEPGEELLLCLTFIDKVSKKVIPNQQVSFYHTSIDGKYEPTNANDETTARLNGTGITDEFGNIYVKTILPGDYGSSENNRHIHTTVYGAKPEAYDIFFKQYSSGVGKLLNSGNDQIFFADLKKTSQNKLICFVTIEVKNLK